MENNMLEQAVMALLEVVGAHPDFNGPLGKALTEHKVDLSALNVCEETTDAMGAGAMEKGEQTDALRQLLGCCDTCAVPVYSLSDWPRYRCALVAIIAELAADEEKA